MSSKHLIYLLLLLLVGCGYDRHEECVPRFESVSPTLHTKQLALYAAEGAVLPEGSIIEGVVVANDASGNFYRAIVLEVEEVGVELRLALYDLHALYPVGATVVVHCGGLRATYIDGVLTIGRAVYGWSGGNVEPVAPRSEVLGRVAIVEMGEEPSATLCTIGELGGEMCGRLVQVEGLRYEGEPATWGSVEYVGDADREMVDLEESSVKVRTHSYADFASVGIPEGELTVRGILYKEGEGYVIKPRVRDDIIE